MENKLPKGWVETELKNLYEVAKEKGDQNIIPYLEIGNVDINTKEYSLTDKPSVKGCIKAKKNDVLVSRVRPTRGAITIIKENDLLVSSAFTVLRNSYGLNEKYLFYFLAHNGSFLNYLGENCTGTMYPTVGESFIVSYNIPLAPLPEQQRIVEKLYTLMARIDNCKARLNKIPILLKNFRQSVLVAAISGELTKKWREENEELSKWKIKKAEDVCQLITKGTTPTNNGLQAIGEIPYLKVYNIVDQKIDFTYKPQFVSKEIHNNYLKRSRVYPGDVLMNIVGPPLGKVAIVPNQYPEWNINQAIAFFRPKEILLSEFVYIILCEGTPIIEIEKEYRGTAGQSNISLEQCRNFDFPVPSIKEQKEIVRKVEELFHFADSIEARYQKAKAWFDKLPQAILAKAFRGELVPQNENDESATKLLDRIKYLKAKESVIKSTSQKGITKKKANMKSDNTIDLKKELSERFKKTKFQFADFNDIFGLNNYNAKKTELFNLIKQEIIEMSYDSKKKKILFRMK